MEAPEYCSVCHRTLRRLKHVTAHEGVLHQDAELRTCPHNLHVHAFEAQRHDEWHRCSHGWVKREQ